MSSIMFKRKGNIMYEMLDYYEFCDGLVAYQEEFISAPCSGAYMDNMAKLFIMYQVDVLSLRDDCECL